MHKLLPSAATRIPRAGDKTSPYERRNSEARCRQSCWGWGEVLQSVREHIGRAWKEEACNLRSFWRRTLEVSQRGGFGHSSRLYITASVLLGGETQHVSSVTGFFCLAPKCSNKQWRACRAAWSWCLCLASQWLAQGFHLLLLWLCKC